MSQRRGPITGSYSRDYNIIEVDAVIRRHLDGDLERRKAEFAERIKLIEQTLLRPQTVIQQRKLLSDREELLRERESLSGGTQFQEYRDRTEDLIARYTKLRPIISVRSFGKKNQELDSSSIERLEVIDEYLEIAREYYPISVHRERPLQEGCPSCGANDEEIDFSDNGMSYCQGCGVERKILVRLPSQREISDEPVVNSGSYETRGNYYKAIIRFQGKQSNRLPKNLEETLDRYFTARDFPSGSRIREMPLLRYGRRCEKTSSRWMYKALSDCGLSAYYEDWRLICKIYWGWELLDLGDKEDYLMELYDKTQRVLESIPNKVRKAALNVQFQLRGTLMGIGEEVINDDFKVIKTDDTIAEHERLWKFACSQTGIKYIPI